MASPERSEQPTRVGVGESASRDSGAAGRESATAAMAALEGRAAALVLVFATAGHDQAALLRGIAEATDGAPMCGCSAEGVITRRGSDESSHYVAVTAIASSDIFFDTYSVSGLAADARRCATELAAQVAASGRRGGLLLLFPDGLTANCAELLEGLESRLPFPVTLAGGTAGDLLRFERTFQYHDGAARSDSVSAVHVSGAVEVELTVSHGCDVVGREQRITRAEGGFVHEIDGRPAWTLFKSYLAGEAKGLEAMHVAHLLLAERVGAEAPASLGGFVVRVPVKLDLETGALFFAAGLREGATVQLAMRNSEQVSVRSIASARELFSRRPTERPLLVLDLECAGRGRLLFGDDTTARLVHPVLEVLAHDVPWVGLHTYGEIAPAGGRTYFHNYTGVLCALYPKAR